MSVPHERRADIAQVYTCQESMYALGVDKFRAYRKKNKPRLWPINKDGALAISWNIILSAVVSWLVS